MKYTNDCIDILCDYLSKLSFTGKKTSIMIMVNNIDISQFIAIALEQLNYNFIHIDPTLRIQQLEEIIRENSVNLIISVHDFIQSLNKLLWDCQDLHAYLCVDTSDPYQVEENIGKLMNKKLWEVVSINAKNEIEGGGWINSYTKEYFTELEMNEFADNAFKKIQSIIGNNANKRVFEIGCASGFTMFRLISYVKEYVAIDLSKSNINKNKEKARRLGYTNVKLFDLPADRISELGEKDFDLIIMNSVTQCMPGINYLRHVILEVIKLIKDEGYIFIGDVMDLNKRESLFQSLIEFKKKQPEYDTKLDLSQELYLAKEYFMDICATIPEVYSVTFSDKIGAIKNELTEYRYDVILKINKWERSISEKQYKYQLGCKII